MSNDASESAGRLSIDQREGGFALVLKRTDGSVKELPLTAEDVLQLNQLVPPTAHRILQSQYVHIGQKTQRFVTPIKGFVLNSDLLAQQVLLTIEDRLGANVTYAMLPQDAHNLAASLVRWAESVAQTSSTSTRQ